MVQLTLLPPTILAFSVVLCQASIANICVQEPFRQMQNFRDFKPAMDRCATHYPVATSTKTLQDRCLTSTKTVILGTSTIPALKHLPCPSTMAMEFKLEIRDAGPAPTPAAVIKRDDAAPSPTPKSAEWSSYFATLVQCGYNCIQTACSCVASPVVELRTPTPTCTLTTTKQTIVHETETIEVAPTSC